MACLVIAKLPPVITVPEVELPAPIRDIPDSVIVVQLHVPAGTVTVEPAGAELIAFCTSVWEHDAAFIVAALSGCTLIAARKILASTNSHWKVHAGKANRGQARVKVLTLLCRRKIAFPSFFIQINFECLNVSRAFLKKNIEFAPFFIGTSCKGIALGATSSSSATMLTTPM